MFIRDLIYFFTTKLTITDKRIRDSKGLIYTREPDRPLNEITEVGQGLFGKMFSYGTIRVTTVSIALKFRYISNPNDFKAV